MDICNGDGFCLTQTGNGYTYIKRDGISCDHNCQPVKCPNFLVCEVYYPQHILWCHKGTCVNCAISFGRLEFLENTECPICFETKLGVKTNKCEHSICVDCFKKCHMPSYWNVGEPQFPYDSDVEDRYEDNPYDVRWQLYPLIQEYNEAFRVWDEHRQKRYDSEENLRKCPLCRK